MSNVAKKDENGRNTMTAASNSNGNTVIPLTADPTNHGLDISDGSSGSDNGNNNGVAMVDENNVSVLTAMSSANDGTIIELYADSVTKKLLVKST